MRKPRDFKNEKAKFNAKLQGAKDQLKAKKLPLFDPVVQGVTLPIIDTKKIKKIGCEVLGQPFDLPPEELQNHHHIGNFQIGLSITGTEAVACSFPGAINAQNVWTFDEYLHAVRSVDGWTRTWNTYDDAVARWEHSELEAQERYELQKQQAQDRYDEKLMKSYDSDKPFYGTLKTVHKPNEKPRPSLTLTANQIMFCRWFDRSANKSNLDGYLAYIRNVSEDLFKQLLEEIPAYVSEGDRIEHTYIVGGTGSGKSELMKSIIHSYISNNNASVVVLDPNGDFAGQIARWKEFINNPRLVFLEYNLKLGHTFTINPFEISGVDPNDRSPKAINTRIVVADQLQDAFVKIVAGGGGGEDFTTNMKSLLMPCIITLLEKPGATILDLQRFMDDEKNDDLIAFAKSLKHYENNVIFFEDEFSDKSYNPTKKAVAKKIRSLLNFPAFAHMTCGKSTVDLEALANDKKVIIFNIAKGRIGNSVTGAFGRLVVSMLQGMALRREEIPKPERVPCHLFLDECHNFISASIEEVMTEARKYGLHLTMAQQAIGYKMSTALKGLVNINTTIKISGLMPKGAWKATADYIGADDPQDFARLKQGRYIMAVDRMPPILFSGRTDLLDDKNCSNSKLWALTKSQQLRFYRDISQDVKAQSIDDIDLSDNTPEEAEEINKIVRRDVLGYDIR